MIKATQGKPNFSYPRYNSYSSKLEFKNSYSFGVKAGFITAAFLLLIRTITALDIGRKVHKRAAYFSN